MAELVEDGESGLHALPADVEDWRRVIRRLLEEDGLLARLGAKQPPVMDMPEHYERLRSIWGGLLATRAR
jgi:glycosyltransferase involved in cell wall biosynthesis